MRTRTKLLIARQIGISEGYQWAEKPNPVQMKKQAQLMTLAENILATVERGTTNIRWATLTVGAEQ